MERIWVALSAGALVTVVVVVLAALVYGAWQEATGRGLRSLELQCGGESCT